ncbi:hypothetical protein SAMN05192534_101568 [Alteribacillus persepolensis]|uniref:Uncharacterized protein n=1 Tax=Alteribacillus persepolensis TaxID=568899 RepID=A0A1G7ZJF4_9BACI|nr:hypothetical protein SAMN05192534_101568 [Alteribacillus persepolensis]
MFENSNKLAYTNSSKLHETQGEKEYAFKQIKVPLACHR